MVLPFNNKHLKIEEILRVILGDRYNIDINVFNASDYGIGQRRLRAIIRLYKKGKKWGNPKKSDTVYTVEDIIGFLPSVESGEKTDIKWHFARKHSANHIKWMQHTPTGKTAFDNDTHYPSKPNGEKIKSYNTSYRRIRWDEPAPTITMRNDAISSQLNVHPGRKLSNGIYSDARVLTPLELMLLSSIPQDWNIPDDTPELLIRRCIGECVPPKLIKSIVSEINK